MKKERKKHTLEIEKYQKMLDKAFLDKDIDAINDLSTKLKLIEKKIVSVDTNYSNFDSYKQFIDYLVDGYCEGKWYEYEHYLALYSKVIGNENIVVEGIGEEDDDRWEKTWNNGKLISHKVAKFVFVETLGKKDV